MSITYNFDPVWIDRDNLPDADADKNILAVDFYNEWVKLQTALAQAAPSASPTFTGSVTFDNDVGVNGTLTTNGIVATSLTTSGTVSANALSAPTISGTTVSATGNISATGNVTGANLNVAQWDSTQATVTAGSANWDSAYSTVTSKAAGWDSTKTTVDAGAAGWDATKSTVDSKAAGWDATKSTVDAGAAGWSATKTTVDSKESVWDAKIGEAPLDALQYVRVNGAWATVDVGDGGDPRISDTAINNWNTAYGWGDHSVAGYLTSFTESDPTVPSHVKSITSTEKGNWNTAYGWGDHGAAGYALDANVPSNTGTGASGTWPISISGNAATATSATSATSATTATTASSVTNGVYTTGNQTIGGVKTFSSTIQGDISGNAATATQATNATNANSATSATTAASCTGNSATATTATNCSRTITAGTNLTGGGALTANRTISLVDSPSVTSLVLGNFTLIDNGTQLEVQYSGNTVFKISSTGAVIAEGDVTANGTA